MKLEDLSLVIEDAGLDLDGFLELRSHTALVITKADGEILFAGAEANRLLGNSVGAHLAPLAAPRGLKVSRLFRGVALHVDSLEPRRAPTASQDTASQDTTAEESRALLDQQVGVAVHKLADTLESVFTLLANADESAHSSSFLERAFDEASTLVSTLAQLEECQQFELGEMAEEVCFDLHNSLEELAELFAEPSLIQETELYLDYLPTLPRYVRGEAHGLRSLLCSLIEEGLGRGVGGELRLVIQRPRRPGVENLEFVLSRTQPDPKLKRKQSARLLLAARLAAQLGGQLAEVDQPEELQLKLNLPITTKLSPRPPSSTTYTLPKRAPTVAIVSRRPVMRDALPRWCRRRGLTCHLLEAEDQAIAAYEDALSKPADRIDALLIDGELRGESPSSRLEDLAEKHDSTLVTLLSPWVDGPQLDEWEERKAPFAIRPLSPAQFDDFVELLSRRAVPPLRRFELHHERPRSSAFDLPRSPTTSNEAP